MEKVESVDEYIENAPAEVQEKLRNLRKVILKLIPQAEEKISYGMPYYGYKGRLVYFAHAKKHIGLYIPPPIIEQYQSDLKNYITSKSAVQFPLEEELPIELIEKLITARIAWNAEREKK